MTTPLLVKTGNPVKNATFGKLKIGTARGVPAARIAVYKLVLRSLRYGFMTRAFAAAIEDKVDISIGRPNDDEKIKMRESDYFDEIELGTYKAMLRLVLQVQVLCPEKLKPKAGPKRTTERARSMHHPRAKEGKRTSRPMHQPKPKDGKEIEVDEWMKTKMDSEVDQALHKPEEQIYQVYFDTSGGDKVALPDHKKFLEDVFGSRASELETTVNPINGHVFAVSLTEEKAGMKHWGLKGGIQ